jgi:serine/threonine protein phosphatase 1
MMSVYAIGDIHGCLRALLTLLRELRPSTDDTVVLLGDYVNRGPDSRGVIERILYLRNETNLIALRGNHDAAMIDARRDEEARRYWRRIGGDSTLASYPGGTLEDVPPDHWSFLIDGCRDWHETETHIYVHATLDPRLDPEEQSTESLYWARVDQGTKPHKSGKTVICGHTSQRSGRPLDLGHTVCIDTGCVYGLWLTGVDVASGRVWQTNQGGEIRTGQMGR